MKKLALRPPGDTIPALRDVKVAPPLHRERTVSNDVIAPRWSGYAGGKSHAFLVPAGPMESPTGTLKAVCGKTMTLGRLTSVSFRCKSCVTALAEDTRKRGTGLTESQIDIVDTGSQDGDPRDADKRRAAELTPLSGDAPQTNADIADALRTGEREQAMESARALDARAKVAANEELPALAPVYDKKSGRYVSHRSVRDLDAARAPIGSRDHGMLDGVAMVQGPNMPPVRGTWRNPVTKELEPAAARLDGSLAERPDREASTVPMVGADTYGRFAYLTKGQYDRLSRTQQRKYWVKIKRDAEYARRRRTQARASVPVRQGTGGTGSRSFAEGDSAETERVMQQARS